MLTNDQHGAVEEDSRSGRQNYFLELDVQNRLYDVQLNPLIPEHPVPKPKYDWAPPRARLEVGHFDLK